MHTDLTGLPISGPSLLPLCFYFFFLQYFLWRCVFRHATSTVPGEHSCLEADMMLEQMDGNREGGVNTSPASQPKAQFE